MAVTTVDLGSVIGPPGPTGKDGKDGKDGVNGKDGVFTGGEITGNTNFTGKLQQAGSDVITIATISGYLSTSNATPIVKLMTSSGTYIPTAGIKGVYVEIVGGGMCYSASSTNDTAYSSSAGYAAKYYSANDLGSSVSVVIGAAGESKYTPAGTTTFKNMKATGGNSGLTGGVGTGGDINLSGSFYGSGYIMGFGNSCQKPTKDARALSGAVRITEYF